MSQFPNRAALWLNKLAPKRAADEWSVPFGAGRRWPD